MKKRFFYAAAIAVLGTSVLLQSCKKEEEVAENAKSYASLGGYAYAETDLTNAVEEYAPEGTKVVVTVNPVNYSSNPEAGVAYETVTYATTIDDKGRFDFDSIEAYGNDIKATVMFSDFSALTKISDTEEERNTYSTGDETPSLVSGLHAEVDVTYNY